MSFKSLLEIRSKTHFLCGTLRISVPLCVAKEMFHRETQRRLREARRKSPESILPAAFLVQYFLDLLLLKIRYSCRFTIRQTTYSHVYGGLRAFNTISELTVAPAKLLPKKQCLQNATITFNLCFVMDERIDGNHITGLLTLLLWSPFGIFFLHLFLRSFNQVLVVLQFIGNALLDCGNNFRL